MLFSRLAVLFALVAFVIGVLSVLIGAAATMNLLDEVTRARYVSRSPEQIIYGGSYVIIAAVALGTLAEMTEGDIYDAVDRYSKQGKIAYIHLRNVVGKVPTYRETFIDEGDVDMLRILTILANNDFDGVVIPDHTPQMTCAAPWHAGMAHTVGFILAAQAMLETSAKKPRGFPAEPPDARELRRGRKS